MGEVYRARDAKLNRDVALKILPDAFVTDPDRLARFRREAQVLASLNHANIGHIYGFEDSGTSHALVLELIEGPTLADRLEHGPVALTDAVPIARQIAEALEAAHDHGVIHRDLKPANIKVSDDGTVKVLDFGLAKVLDPTAGSSAEVMNSPTLTARATQLGMILGTAAYMSPEQAKGRPVDKRADVWAFGAVLYEMLCGQRAFKGDDVSDTLAAVLRQDIDWSALPATTPAAVRQIIARCLDRDPKRRLRDIGEARIALESPAAAIPGQTQSAAEMLAPSALVQPQRRFGAVHAIAAGLLVALVVVSWFWWRAAGPTTATMARVAVTLPPEVSLNLAIHPIIAISRDGSKIALVANRKGAAQLYLRPMNEFEPRAIAGTDDASSPFFSPNGSWIGFFAEGKLKKVPAAGGPVITLAEGVNDNRGGVWTDDDTIIYAPGPATPVYRVPAAGGTPAAVSTIDDTRHERTHRWPELLPDGKTVLVTVGSIEHPDDYDEATIEAIRLDTGARHMVLKGGRTARYASSGHLLFLRNKVLFAVPFDAGQAMVHGTPVPVIDGISGDVTTGSAHYAVSADGTIVFVPGDPSGGVRRLAWVDKQGKVAAIDVPAALYGDPHVSPDGRRVAVAISIGASLRDIYVVDTVRGTTSRLTFGPAENRTPIWSHDGRRLFYVTYDRTRNASTIMTKAADGTGNARALGEISGQAYAEDVTRDDGTILLSANSSTARGRFEVFRLALQDGSKPTRILTAPNNDVQNSEVSPDGKWIAYYSAESGRPEVYVQSFLSSGSRAQVSTASGTEPRWAPDGRALYYQQTDGMMMVPIDPGPAFSPGKPQMLFSGVSLANSDSGQTYAVAPRGDRFLMLRPSQEGAPPEVRVIVNWFDELKRVTLP
jgi:serine/threonine-protein kinase